MVELYNYPMMAVYNSLMPYIIDGHNLIPKAGISLADADDEHELIRLLQEFARLKRTKIDVYFDGAPPGRVGSRKHGSITAHFVRQTSSADDAIRKRLHTLGKDAPNWIVVTDDHAVQNSVRANKIPLLSTRDFLGELHTLRRRAVIRGEKQLSENEIGEWLKLFDTDESESQQG
jgi:hypothetical protein